MDELLKSPHHEEVVEALHKSPQYEELSVDAPGLPMSPQCEVGAIDAPEIQNSTQQEEVAVDAPEIPKTSQFENVAADASEIQQSSQSEEVVFEALEILKNAMHDEDTVDAPESQQSSQYNDVAEDAVLFARHFLDSGEQNMDQDEKPGISDESSLPKKRVRQSDDDEEASTDENINTEPADPSQKDKEAANDDEPTYCICRDIFHGRMVLCDDESCRIGWYHFSCVGIKKKPKGLWYCLLCRADREKSKLTGTPGISSGASTSNQEAKNSTHLCGLCNFICFSWEKLEAHKLRHASEKIFKCSNCSFVTVIESAYRKHTTKAHPPQGQYQCSICKYRFEDVQILAAHIAAHETDVDEKEDDDGKLRKFKCAFCDYKGTTLKGLRSHVKTHSTDRPLKRRKITKERRKEEKTPVHSGYFCDFCNYSSGSLLMVEHHTATLHAGKAKCSYCKNEYSSKEDLELHLRDAHSESVASTSKSETDPKIEGTPTVPSYYNQKLYQCRLCDCRFGILVELKDHARCHKR